MAPELRAVDPPEGEVAAPAKPDGIRDKVRLTFRKADSLRWLSHHDLMRTFERMLHRSALPFRRSKGFHPHPRLVFALSLPLGVIGRAEIVELELDACLDLDEIRDRLTRQAPAGLEILTIQRIATNETAQVVGFCYGLVVPADRIAGTRAALDANPLAAECWVERTRPSPRRLDIRPFVRRLHLDDKTGRLEMDLFLTPQGTARPEEVLSLVGLDGLIAAGVPLERVGLELKQPGNSVQCSVFSVQ
jgi:radical SAM-linked protein